MRRDELAGAASAAGPEGAAPGTGYGGPGTGPGAAAGYGGSFGAPAAAAAAAAGTAYTGPSGGAIGASGIPPQLRETAIAARYGAGQDAAGYPASSVSRPGPAGQGPYSGQLPGSYSAAGNPAQGRATGLHAGGVQQGAADDDELLAPRRNPVRMAVALVLGAVGLMLIGFSIVALAMRLLQ